MKKDNMVILFAFFICLGVIIFTIHANNQESELNSPESSQSAQSNRSEDIFSTGFDKLKKGNEILKEALQEDFSTTKDSTDEISNVFAPQNLQDNAFGDYQKYVPFIKELINYAKTHKVPTEDLHSITELAVKTKSPISFISAPKDLNMNYIEIDDMYYIKLLPDLVAIYSNVKYYHIDFDLEGSATCVGKDNSSYVTCQNLGGVNPEPNARIPSWIAYRLPNNIFDK